jgi:hypothetical protein
VSVPADDDDDSDASTIPPPPCVSFRLPNGRFVYAGSFDPNDAIPRVPLRRTRSRRAVDDAEGPDDDAEGPEDGAQGPEGPDTEGPADERYVVYNDELIETLRFDDDAEGPEGPEGAADDGALTLPAEVPPAPSLERDVTVSFADILSFAMPGMRLHVRDAAVINKETFTSRGILDTCGVSERVHARIEFDRGIMDLYAVEGVTRVNGREIPIGQSALVRPGITVEFGSLAMCVVVMP